MPPSTRERRLTRVALDAHTHGHDARRTGASLGQIVFSPTGTRVAYVVRLEVLPTQGTPGGPIGAYAVVDGKAGPVLDALSPPVFSPDGEHVAYSGHDGQGSVLFVDGELRRPGRIVYPPAFGRGGSWAYVESSRFGDKMAIVVDGKTGPWFDYVWPHGFTPDGRKVVYQALRQGKRFVVVGPERSRLLDKVGEVAFDRTGALVAYHGCQGDRCSVFVRGRPPEELPPGAEHITFAPDLRRVAFQLAGGFGRRWVVDGREQPPFDDVAPSGAFVFSPSGASFAYAAWKSGRSIVVRDGAPAAEHDEVGALAFSPDGKTLAYAARDGERWRIVVGGEPQAAFGAVGEPTFAPDGRTVVYTAREGDEAFLVVGAERHGPFTDVYTPVAFSADGARIAFGARAGDELWWKVVPITPGR